ncbi:ADP-ribosylation factor-like protein 6-interacting protein 1 isoform X1 [Tribolium castaneum]|uniref:ARL-6-interacting protein 1 homolog-like Protein n=1 Tax=Tribolium castaneum TaxID=7070 RepID=D6X2T5_TRICA|nr:PREDICTED: ADP-ribosylation factor-like protein 6-interacting protein 1 isoform X1 [Tribolium castaneum]EFA10290.2 ARL-6-interacting protein 1 homolog-like Protein [Tribolium castaneum]|eukprot:XP_015839229.1 PREDICTED: ADP-ribosylation factor-like protein 6-interacting protein 1 isoform X1 [Tribolium castaneum]
MADQAGDSPSESKYTHSFETEPPYETREYKFTYPSIMEAQIRKLRHGLENWREIILGAKRVLVWEKQWHPTAIVGGSTILFTFLWLLDPSILTVFSVFGLVLTIFDYLIPSIGSSMFKPEMWTARKEQEYEEFCTNVILYKARLELSWARFYKMKSTNRKMYFLLTMITLSALAWIGCTFNNLFLSYVFVTFLLLFPGMEHNGIITKWSEYVGTFLMELMRQTKSKGSQEKDD